MKHLATKAAQGRVGDKAPFRSSGVISEIDAVIAERSMLKHPFYQAWTAGTLPVESLREYARQYFHFEAAFPTFLSAVHSKCAPGPIRSTILGNLWDEESGADNHLALWLRFAEAVGLSEAEVRASEPNAETRALIEGFRTSCRDGSVAEGLATIYAYEAQASDVAREKIAGLVRFYGMEEAGYRFFSVHQELDVQHAQVERTAIAAAATTDAQRHSLEEAARQAADRLWRFLDGAYAAESAQASCGGRSGFTGWARRAD